MPIDAAFYCCLLRVFSFEFLFFLGWGGGGGDARERSFCTINSYPQVLEMSC
jgi:hypothetical protein